MTYGMWSDTHKDRGKRKREYVNMSGGKTLKKEN